MIKMDYTEIDVNAVCFGILCNFTPVCGQERAKEAAELVRKIYEERKSLMAHIHELETTHRTERCSDGYDCVQLGKARKAVADAEARAEKAERERDAAVEDMRGICYLCANAKPYSALSRTVMTCAHKEYTASTKYPECKYFKWRGQKEE